MPALPKFTYPPIIPSGGDDPIRDIGLGLGPSMEAGPSQPKDESHPISPASDSSDWKNMLGCDLQTEASNLGVLDISGIVHDPSLVYAFDFEGEALFNPPLESQ